jgi:ATP adenylyltransferase
MHTNPRSTGEYDKVWKTVGKCVFCELSNKYIVHTENEVALILNKYPYIDGHLMAVPINHISSVKELSSIQWEQVRKYNYVAKKLFKIIYGYKAMWMLVREGGADAQMSVADHVHIQYIPFDKGDLAKWNYRDLKYTVEESKALIDKYKVEIEKYLVRFDKKYLTNTNKNG